MMKDFFEDDELQQATERIGNLAAEIRESEAYPALLGALAGGIAGALAAAKE